MDIGDCWMCEGVGGFVGFYVGVDLVIGKEGFSDFGYMWVECCIGIRYGFVCFILIYNVWIIYW